MTGSEAIVIMQRLFKRAGCPMRLKPTMTMAGVLQLAEFWLDNMDERDRVLGETAPAIPAGPVIETGFARIK